MFVKKVIIRYDLAKDQSELTWRDFEQFPVWVNCLELEDIGGETMFAPVDPPLFVPVDAGLAFVKAEFRLADGTTFQGIVEVEAYAKSLKGIALLLDYQEFFSVEPPPVGKDIPEWYQRELEMYGHEALCCRLGRSEGQVFPIRFRCPVGFEGEEGVIEGEYPMDFRIDRPIRLVRWREHILYEASKKASEMTWQDFDHFPFFWETCGFLVPIDLPYIPTDADEVWIKAEFFLADGTFLKGAVKVNTWRKTLEHIMVIIGDQLKWIHESRQLCEVLGKGVREVFPVRFRCFIGFEGEEGVIEGEIPKTFHYNRPIKLGKGRKRR